MLFSKKYVDIDEQLFDACMNPKTPKKEIEKLISLGADVNAHKKNGTTPLIVAARYTNDVNIINTLLNNGANINTKTKSYQEFLIRCAMEKEHIFNKIKDADDISEEVEELIEEEFVRLLNTKDKEKYAEGDYLVDASALLYAARFNKNSDILKCLLDNGADITDCDEEGQNALLLAAQFNPNPAVIKTLLDYGMSKSDLDVALYVACRDNPSVEVVDYLVSIGANLNIKVNEEVGLFAGPANQTILDAASHNPNPEIFVKISQLFTKKGVKNTENPTKLLIDLIESFDYHPGTIKALIDMGADVNAKTGRESVLYNVLKNTLARPKEKEEDKEIVRILVDNGSVVTSDMLNWVIREKDFLDILVPACTDIEKTFEYLLQMTKYSEHIEFLINKGVNPNSIDITHTLSDFVLEKAIRPIPPVKHEIKIPLMEATTYNSNPNIISTLIKCGANPNYATKTGRTVLMNAITSNSNIKVIETLINLGADVNTNNNYSTALIFAVNRRLHPDSKFTKTTKLELIKMLLEAGADVNAVDKYGNSALVYAVKIENIDIINLLLSYGADPFLCNEMGQNAQFFTKNTKIISILKKAKPSTSNLVTFVPEDIDTKSLDKILQKDTSSTYLNTLLFNTVANNTNIKIIERLIKSGADVNFCTTNGITILMAALNNPNSNVVKYLLSNGAEVNFIGERGLTPLMHAISVDAPIESIKILLENGADVNAKDERKKTPLLYATYYDRDIQLLKLLLDNGADPNAKDKNQNTPLLKLVSRKASLETFPNKKDVIQQINNSYNSVLLLLEHGADPNKSPHSCLMEAVRLNDVQLAKVLLDNGADINERSKYYGTVFDLAYSKKMTDLLKKYSKS